MVSAVVLKSKLAVAMLHVWSCLSSLLTTVLSLKMNLLETLLERAADASNKNEITRNMQAKAVVNEQG